MNIIKNIIRFSLFLSIGSGILYLLYLNLDTAYQAQCKLDGIPAEECSLLNKVFNDFKNAHYFWVALVLISFTASNVSRAIRWQMLIKPLGYQVSFMNSILAIFLGYFANLGLPRIGEVIRAGTMAKYEKIPVEKLMGTVVVGRIVDVICLLIVVGLSFLLAFQRIWGYLGKEMDLGKFENLLLSPLLWSTIGILLLITAGLWYKRDILLNTTIAQKVKKVLSGFAEGLQSIRHIKKPGWFLFHSVNIWFLYFLMTYLCFFAYDPTSHLGPLAGLLVFVFGAFGFVLPSPGGMGTYHVLTIAALAIFGINKVDAFSFANISFFSIQIGCNVLLGILSLFLLPLVNRKKQ